MRQNHIYSLEDIKEASALEALDFYDNQIPVIAHLEKLCSLK